MSAAKIHSTALVASGAELGKNVTIGPYAIIEDDVQIGDNCVISSHAVIHQYVRMGQENTVFPHATIGGLPQDTGFDPVVKTGVHIGDGNTLRENVTINRSTVEGESTQLGSNCFMMSNTHVAHDCVVGDAVILASGTHLAGHVQVGNNVFFGGGAMIHQFCRIGTFSIIRGTAGISKDIIPFTMAGGFPVLHYRLNLVGLRRSGLSRERLKVLSSAYRALRNNESIDGFEQTEEIIELQNWLASKSLRGIHRFAKIETK